MMWGVQRRPMWSKRDGQAQDSGKQFPLRIREAAIYWLPGGRIWKGRELDSDLESDLARRHNFKIAFKLKNSNPRDAVISMQEERVVLRRSQAKEFTNSSLIEKDSALETRLSQHRCRQLQPATGSWDTENTDELMCPMYLLSHDVRKVRMTCRLWGNRCTVVQKLESSQSLSSHMLPSQYTKPLAPPSLHFWQIVLIYW